MAGILSCAILRRMPRQLDGPVVGLQRRALLSTALLVLAVVGALALPSAIKASTRAGVAGPPQSQAPTSPDGDRPLNQSLLSESQPFGYVYVVQPGDDLWLIAVSHDLDMEVLAAENSLQPPYWLHPGDKLWVPAAPATVQRPRLPASEASAPEQDPGGYTYVVQSGDDLWQIATANDLVMEDLAAANDLDPPYWLQPGDSLWIPAAEGVGQAGVPATQSQGHEAGAANQVSQQSTATEGAAVSVSQAPAGLSDWQSLLLTQFNQQRAERGLAALHWSSELAAAAQAHAEDLAGRGWGSHTGSDGARLRERLARVGYWADWASENWANSRSAQHAFDMWWYEPPGYDPHRQNILGPNFTELGIGVAQGGWGYYFVADFGSR